jgi:peptidase E
VPDVRAHLLSQDVILVEGGSVVNLVAVWRAHSLPEILRECWETGIVLTGASAGSLCWHVGGPTDSFRDNLDPFTDGLAFLPYSNGVHDDLDDQPRRTTFRELIANGKLPAGYATEDGTGLLYAGTELLEAVTILPRRHAWHVTPDGNGGYAEQAIVPPPHHPWPRLRGNATSEDRIQATQSRSAGSKPIPALGWPERGNRLVSAARAEPN